MVVLHIKTVMKKVAIIVSLIVAIAGTVFYSVVCMRGVEVEETANRLRVLTELFKESCRDANSKDIVVYYDELRSLVESTKDTHMEDEFEYYDELLASCKEYVDSMRSANIKE